MKTLKVLSIIGLVLASISLMVVFIFDTSIVSDAEAIAGWLFILSSWSIAQSIVTIVKSKKVN